MLLCRHSYWRRIVLLRGQMERRTLRYFTTCCLELVTNSGKSCCYLYCVNILIVVFNYPCVLRSDLLLNAPVSPEETNSYVENEVLEVLCIYVCVSVCVHASACA